MHHSNHNMMAEHMAALALVAYEDATHMTVASGDWCDPNIWHNRAVPGDDARVVVSLDHKVNYALVDTARLHTLRVDGELHFATDKNTRITFDTLMLDPRGTLTIGTEQKPLSSNIKANLVIADNGDIDVDWDPLLLSRGVIAHGTLRIHGAKKTPHIKLGQDAYASENTLILESAPQGWRVGDTLVVTGTRFSGWKWDNSIGAVRYHATQDEVRTITGITGNTVTLDSPLVYDHVTPRADLKASIGNFSRNVRFVTENVDSLPAYQRGHVMFMHNNNIDVRYAEFFELGRTDKSQTNMEVADVDIINSDTNVRGRYSFHFHRAGVEDQNNPAIGIGNAVFGSPGWGYVHHDSHAILHNNLSFNTFGAGFVAETGNETGIWSNNLAVKAEGISSSYNPKNNNDIQTYDIARSGDAFWFQGRMVASVDNVAASVNRGYTYFHRDKSGTMIRTDPQLFMAPQALGLSKLVGADKIPIRHFHGNEAYASTVGLFVVKANPRQGHDIYTVMTDFTAWEVQTGASIEYTAHYLLRDFDLIGLTSEPFRKANSGIEIGRNTSGMIVRDARIDGFEFGVSLSKEHTTASARGKDQFVVIGGELSNIEGEDYRWRDSSDLFIDSNALKPNQFTVDLEQVDADGYASYLNAGDMPINGIKTDSIGSSPVPGGDDSLGSDRGDMIALLAQEGYYQTQNGDHYTVVQEFFSDRATGEVHMLPLKTYLGPDVAKLLGNQYNHWSEAKYKGIIDLDNQPPVARNDSASVANGNSIQINALANDSDPENDQLRILAVVSPVNGLVSHTDTHILYRANFDYQGVEEFHYWVGDEHGNAHRAKVSVTVH